MSDLQDVLTDFYVYRTPVIFASEPVAIFGPQWRKRIKAHIFQYKHELQWWLMRKWLHARFRVTYRLWFRLWAMMARKRHRHILTRNL